MPFIPRFYTLAAACFLIGVSSASFAAVDRPNVLFIALDDLNDWVGCLGGHPQTLTPNIDRLAKSGVLFTNAHAPAASCNPSRTAIFTGRAPSKTGLYSNNQKMRGLLPKKEIIPKTLSRHGYHAAGAGKLLHYFIDAPSWNDYFPEAEKENPFPRTLLPAKRPLSLPKGGAWQYRETDWGALDATDEESGGDFLVTQWVSEQLQQKETNLSFSPAAFIGLMSRGLSLPNTLNRFLWSPSSCLQGILMGILMTYHHKGNIAVRIATWSTSAVRANGSRRSKAIWPRSTMPTPWWAVCLML